jgi:glycerol-3-phosphate dehydrogenase
MTRTDLDMARSHHWERLQTEQFDLCIIGAGASGAGCALDAALRGLKVALIDRDDFAGGTSSRSTKLIHGGVRYLEQAFKNFDFAQLRQVQHGLHERHTVLSNAPHLARPLALITPVGSWFEGLYFRIGLWLYDRFASKNDTLPKSRWITRKAAQELIPRLHDKFHSAVKYYDGQLDDARYALALVQSAVAAGAAAVNHAALIGFQHDASGGLQAAHVRDGLGNAQISIRASVFLNCTGPFADPIRRMANPDLEPRISPSKGVHVILPQSVMGNDVAALLIPKTPDGRMVFAIPFGGSTLLGTTDTPYKEPEKEPVLDSNEVDWLLETLEPYVSWPVDRSAVRAGFGGLRPLISVPAAAGRSTKTLLRDHEVEVDAKSGLLSLLGGKWTTYRIMAKDAVDAVCQRLQRQATCQTATHKLWGGAHFNVQKDLAQWAAQQGVSEPTARHLTDNYGDQAERVLEVARSVERGLEPLHGAYPFVRGEVVYAARYEMCATIRDFVARRVRLEILDWAAAQAVVPQVAQLLGRTLGWSTAKEQQQVIDYQELIASWIKSADLPTTT